MDCPRFLRAWPMASVLAVSVGCLPSSELTPGPTPTPLPGLPEVVKEKDGPPRKLKATTCVSLGDLYLRGATQDGVGAKQREDCLDKARRCYQEALERDAKCVAAQRGLAQTYQELGDHDRATACFQKAIKLSPKDASLCFEFGMFYGRNKEWDRSLENLKTAAEKDPENRDFQRAYGFALARVGRYDDSYACLKKVMPDAQAHYNLARMMHHNKDEEGCKVQLALALQADPGLAEAREFQGEAQLALPATAVTAEKAAKVSLVPVLN